MRIQYEDILPDANSSFRLMVNPRLNDFFFWHSHPEYELVYIEGANGTRHVGEHISRYTGSDLVFIGSNIPHLNFDYGVKTDYEKVVLHIRQDFLSQGFAGAPELSGIRELFEQARKGIAYGEATKAQVGARMKQLQGLAPFEQFLEVLQLMQALALAPDKALLHSQPIENQYTQREQDRLRRLYQFIDESYRRKIGIPEAASLSNLSSAAFCRYFKKMTRLTFTEFLNRYRINQAKNLLLAGSNVSEACFECGFESLSYFNRTFKKITGVNPLAFKKLYTQHPHL
ncbi:MAG: AraC family transcriptional regulator [Bacteroidetes bacterium]|nr:MAG: AraC family transcriptional regulator [Bacteroidota bacterium]